MKLTDEELKNLSSALAIIKLERVLNKKLMDFGQDGFITITEWSRNLTAEQRKAYEKLIDELEARKV